MDRGKSREPGGRTVGVLFVCTGNICRSPTAVGVLRTMIARAGLAQRVRVDSCGVYSGHIGEPPDPRAQEHARRRGYEIGDLRARALDPGDFAAFDYLLAMDESHLRALRRMAPATLRARVRLFLEFAQDPSAREVPDPYYGDAADFERALDLIERGAAGLLAELHHALR